MTFFELMTFNEQLNKHFKINIPSKFYQNSYVLNRNVSMLTVFMVYLFEKKKKKYIKMPAFSKKTKQPPIQLLIAYIKETYNELDYSQ